MYIINYTIRIELSVKYSGTPPHPVSKQYNEEFHRKTGYIHFGQFQIFAEI